MSGRPFLQIPGPTLVPDRVVRAMSQPIIDHRGPEFGELLHECLGGLKPVFGTERGTTILFPGSGTGAWESAIVNTLSPGDKVLACVNGHFSEHFMRMAQAHGIDCETIETPYGVGVSATAVEERLRADKQHQLRAVMVVHNETSTGVLSDVAAVRQAMDATDHPALLIVDTVSSLASSEFRMDEWQVDVALTGSQKGLMLPPGMAMLAVSEKALAAARTAASVRSYWDWTPMIERNRDGLCPYTPATTLLFGLREALQILQEEGLPNVFRRHNRLAEACRRAVQGLGLDLLCRNSDEYSSTVTAVIMPSGADSDAFILHANETLGMSLGVGLSAVKGKIFRIGHLGSLNELELLGGLSGLEMALHSFGIEIPLGTGLAEAERYLISTAPAEAAPAGARA